MLVEFFRGQGDLLDSGLLCRRVVEEGVTERFLGTVEEEWVELFLSSFFLFLIEFFLHSCDEEGRKVTVQHTPILRRS